MRNILKYIAIALTLCFCVNIQGNAQTLEDLLNKFATKKSSAIISKAVSPDLYIIRQQYRLEKDGNFYGKKKLPFYGESYSLAVKVASGMYLQRDVILPWSNDDDYKRVNQSGKYTPAYFWSKKRALNDSIYESIELELNTRYTQKVTADSSLFFHADAKSDFGLMVDKTADKKEGCLILAYSTTTVRDSMMQVNLQQKDMIVNSKDSLVTVLRPTEPEKLLGGIFVVPYYEHGGRIILKLAGVAVRNREEKWVLHCFAAEEGEPVKKKAKKAKKASNDEDDSVPTIIN